MYHISGDERVLSAVDIFPEDGQVVAVLHDAVDVNVIAHLNAYRLA